MRIFIPISFFLCFSLLSFKSEEKERVAFHFINQDSVEIVVYEVWDTDSTLAMYKSRVKSPVCEGSVCYDVELVFYWNLLGDFVQFELIPGKPLTKLKHEPFTTADYQKLAEILANNESAFAYLKKDDLVPKVANQIDAVSGATLASIKNLSIDGAVYSCYTLWQIANGKVVEGIRRHTQRRMDLKLVRKIMAINSSEADYFLLNNFKSGDFSHFTPEVLELIKRRKGFFGKNAIERMPVEMFSRLEIQSFFSEQFLELGYYSQMAFLQRLENSVLSNPLAAVLIQNLGVNQFQNELIIKLLSENINQLDDAVVRQLFSKIVEKSIQLEKQIYTQIVGSVQKRKSLSVEMKLFKKQYKSIEN